MPVMDKGSILNYLSSPATLSQLHPDSIYAIMKDVSDTM